MPVANVPLLAHSLGLLRYVGVADLTVNVFHRADDVASLVEALPIRDMRVHWSVEARDGGSANVLAQLRPRPTTPFLVVMGDIFLGDLDIAALLDAHHASAAAVTLLASRHEHGHRSYGQICVDGQHRLLALNKEGEGPGCDLVNTGVYLVDPAIIDLVPLDRCCHLGRNLLPALIAAGRTVRVVPTAVYYQRLGSFAQYRLLNTDLISGRARPAYSPVRIHARLLRTTVAPTATLVGDVILGDGCRIGRDVVIQGPSVIGANVTVGRGARLEEVVVLPDTAVGVATHFRRSVLFGAHVAEGEDGEPLRISDPSILCPNEVPTFALAEQLFHSTLALILLFLLAPLLLVVALAIRIESPGPVVYTQLRVGQRRGTADRVFYPGRVFEIIKFRSMYMDADARLAEMRGKNNYASNTFFKASGDPRITRLGRFIRMTSIDELPQLLNVLRGDMRLVGNRPLPLYEAIQFNESWQQVRFDAPAGMTGLWQVAGRSNLTTEERIILDNHYAMARTFWMDMKILLLTVPAVLMRRGSR